MRPRDVVDVLNSVLHGSRSQAVPTRYPHIQGLVSPRARLSNIGFVSGGKTQTLVNSAYKLPTRQLPKRIK
jgi:hypothetical protein